MTFKGLHFSDAALGIAAIAFLTLILVGVGFGNGNLDPRKGKPLVCDTGEKKIFVTDYAVVNSRYVVNRNMEAFPIGRCTAVTSVIGAENIGLKKIAEKQGEKR